MALNSENYENFKKEKSLIKRTVQLEKILKNNIVSYMKAVCPDLKNKINVAIHEIHAHKISKYKNVSFSTFNLTFSVNLKIPNHIGLGKASSVGFGTKQTK
jgi:predicted alternative tryptophan synthase beta-subunit